MTDALLELARNPRAKKLVQSAGLPLPLPQVLARRRGPAVERPLDDCTVLYGGSGALGDVAAHTLVLAGANPVVLGHDAAKPFEAPGEAYGRPATVITNGESLDRKVHAMVFDATGLDDVEKLRALHDFFHPWIRQLAPSGRVVVMGRPAAAAKSPGAAAARAALEGFVRSLAKEVGRFGSTANLIVVDEDAEERLPGVLRFFAAEDSAFVTGQPVHVTAKADAKGEVPWVRPLDGKVALVTGAARGIGAATAELLAAEGAHVVCLDRPEDDDAVSTVARRVHGSVLLADVSDATAPARIADALEQDHGGVDIVVHNAGVTRDRTLAKMSASLWDQAVDINLGAVERITEALLRGPLRDGGRVVCLSSVAGIAGNMGQTNYAASKAGLIGLVQHLAPKVAKRGITVNAVAPGFIETRLTAAIPVVIREVGRRLSALGQGGLPEDVGQAITFLSTPGASGLTGNVLRVCGGAFIGA